MEFEFGRASDLAPLRDARCFYGDDYYEQLAEVRRDLAAYLDERYG